MLDKMTTDFFLYSYFEIEPDDADDVVLKKLVEKAYADATNQGAFNALIHDDTTRDNADACIPETIDTVIKELKNYLNCRNYRCWHTKLCNSLIQIYENRKVNISKKLWTFGNSQKIVNMSVKYVLLISKLPSFKKTTILGVAKKFEKTLKDIDIPIDRIVLKAMIDSSGVLDFKKALESVKKTKQNPSKVDHIYSWSTWDETQYKKFQEEYHKVFDNKTPLEWENENWIEKHS